MAYVRQILIYDNQRLVFSTEISGPTELGRQSDREEGPFFQSKAADRGRIVIAGRDEWTIARRQVLLGPQQDDRVWVENLGGNRPLRLDDGREIAPGVACDLPLPVVISISSSKVVRVQQSHAESPQLHSPPQAAAAPRSIGSWETLLQALPAGGNRLGRMLVRWLQTASGASQRPAQQLLPSEGGRSRCRRC